MKISMKSDDAVGYDASKQCAVDTRTKPNLRFDTDRNQRPYVPLSLAGQAGR